jgi:hypothetical protein
MKVGEARPCAKVEVAGSNPFFALYHRRFRIFLEFQNAWVGEMGRHAGLKSVTVMVMQVSVP